MDVRSPFFQNIALIVAGVMFLNPIVTVAAELSIDAQAGGNTTIGQAGNGVPIVNIATPNGSGLSHNKFTDYNVGGQGLILNNGAQAFVPTQQGGYITGNPNLRGGAANVILNEVTGSNRSQLKGYTEVAGQAAHVIVANPHGITCDGCGFINTPRATLSTGAPMVNNGRLQGFDVDGGDIAIEGAGLNAGNVDQFDLITRSAQINAEIHAKRLNVIAGRNEVDVATLQATAKADDGSQQPQLAIDSSALGGMYAGAIRLVGTEAGVGVKLAGDMAASAGDIQIDASGKLTLGQTSASGNLDIEAHEVALSGKAYAAGKLDINSQRELKVQQSLASGGDLALKGSQIINQGIIEAGVSPDNNRIAADLRIIGKEIRNTGTLIGNDRLQIEATRQLLNQGGTLSGKALTRIDAGHLDNQQGRISGQDKLDVATGSVDNRQGQVSTKQLDIHIRDGGLVDNRQGKVFAEERLSVVAGSLNNSDNGSLVSKGTLDIKLSSHLDNHGQGTLASQDAQSIRAASVDNSNGGLISSRGTLSATDTSFNNQAGQILASGAISFRQGSLDNQGGLLSGQTRIDLELEHLDNRNEGRVNAKGDIEAKVGQLEQRYGGELLSQGNLNIDAALIDNRDGGLIGSVEGLQISAHEALHNSAGEISTPGKAMIRVQSEDRQSSAVLNNSDTGLIVGDKGLELYVQRLLNNAKGGLSSRNGILLKGAEIENLGGKVVSDGYLDIQSESLNNGDEGVISAGKLLRVNTETLDNHSRGLITSYETRLSASRINNSSGATISSNGALSVMAKQLNQHDDAKLVSDTSIVLDLQGGNIDNRGGLITTPGSLLLKNIRAIDNSGGGELSSAKAFKIDVEELNNTAGKIVSHDLLEVRVTQKLLNNLKGAISAAKLAVEAQSLDNSDSGALLSQTDIALDLGEGLDNTNEGSIVAAEAISIKGSSIDNSSEGLIAGGDAIYLSGHKINNSSGSIVGQGNMVIGSGSIDNRGGLISSQQALSLNAKGVDNSQKGLITTTGTLNLTAGNLDSSNEGELSAKNDLYIKVHKLIQQQGRLIGESAVTVDLLGGDLDNREGLLSAEGPLVIHGLNSLDNRAGEVSSKLGYSLVAEAINNGEKGRLISDELLEIILHGDLRNASGLVSGRQGVSIKANSLDNSNGGTLSSSAGSLEINLNGSLSNRSDGALVSQGKITVSASGLDNSEKGIISGASDVDLTVDGALSNSSSGKIDGEGSISITANSLDNSAGDIFSGQSLTLLLAQNLTNSKNGKILSAGTLILNAADLNNQAGSLFSKNILLLTAGRLDNSKGTLIASGGLNASLSGALINSASGSIGSQTGTVEIQAAELDNSGGRIIAQNDLGLEINGELSNTGGVVQATQGNLGIKSRLINNSGGSFSSIQGWLTLIAKEAFHNAGGIAQSQRIIITASGIDNSQGRILALEGSSAINSAGSNFNNESGLIFAKSLLQVSANEFNNQGSNERLGGKVSAGEIDFSLTGALDNRFGLIESESTYNLTANHFDNERGNLRSLGLSGTSVARGGIMDNRGGIIESQNSSLQLNTSGLQNESGLIRHSGRGSLGISSANIMAAGGIINTAGDINIEADSWLNTSIIQAANLTVNVGSFTQATTGQLLASKSLIGNGGAWINNGVLASDGLFKLGLADSYSGSGVVKSLATLDFSAASIDISPTGHISGGDSTSIKNDGLLSNRGRITSAADLVINAGKLNNYGTLGAAGKLSTYSSDLLNEEGLLFSGSDMALRTKSFINKYADVYSLGDLSVSADDAGAKSELFSNRSSTIESAGSISLYSKVISNIKDQFDLSTKKVSGSLGALCLLNCYSEDNGYFMGSGQYVLKEKFKAEASVDSPGSKIAAGKDLRISGASLENLQSLISAGGNIDVSVGQLNNSGAQVGVYTVAKYYQTHGASMPGVVTNEFFDYNSINNPDFPYVEYTAAPSWGNPKSESFKLVPYAHSVAGSDSASGGYIEVFWFPDYYEVDTDRTLKAQPYVMYNQNSLDAYYYDGGVNSAKFKLYGKRDLIEAPTSITSLPLVKSEVVGEFSNSSAIIQAGGSVSITTTGAATNGIVAQFANVTRGQNRVQATALDSAANSISIPGAQLSPDMRHQYVNPVSLPGFTLPLTNNGLFRLNFQKIQSKQASSSEGGHDGAIAPIKISEASNGKTFTALTDSRDKSGFEQAVIDVSIFNRDQLLINGVNAINATQAPPSTHKYLIETNPEFSNLKNFLSSDYLLDKIGFSTDEAQKRLGDGLYEQRLIRDAIVARTGQRFLEGLTSDEAIFRQLMDNAISSKQALNLSVGVGLSAEQVAALTHDIVWIEEHEVAGEKVLVPVLYLAQADGRMAPNGALVQGSDITLISGEGLNNQGTLRATNSISTTAKEITNSGLMQAGDKLSLLATKDILNTQGGILAGRDVNIASIDGDITNMRSVQRLDRSSGNYKHSIDYVGTASRIEAANQLTINAGRDFSNIGSALYSGGALEVKAGQDVRISSVSERLSQSRGSSFLEEQISQIASRVDAGKDLKIEAGRDISVIASQINAAKNADFSAERNVLIASAANEDHFLSKTKRTINQTDQIVQQISEVNAGGSLAVKSGSDLVVSSSHLSAGNEAYLFAGDRLSVLSDANYQYSLFQRKRKGFLGSKSFKRNESTDVSHVGSVISSGGNLSLLSGDDQTYQRARLESGNDLTLISQGAIAFETVKDLKQESREKSDNSFLWQSAKGKGSTDETVLQSQLIARGNLAIKAVEGLKIDVKEVNQQSISQVVNAMVTADPDLAWLKEMEKRGDVDWQRVKEVHDSFKYGHSGLGGAAMIVIAIVVTYLTAGLASGAVGSMAGAYAGSGTAMAAAGTATASAVAGGAAVGSTVAAGWANVALTAVATSAASGAAVSTINNRGDLGAVLKDITSSNNLKGYVTSALTAGITSGVLDSAFGVTGDDVNKVTKGFDLSKADELAKFSSYLGAQGAVQAVAQTAVNGGSLGHNLQEVLTGQVQHLLQAVAFKNVGDLADGKIIEDIDWVDGSPQKVALHAIVGGMLSEATGGDFKTGALATGANELLIEKLSAIIKGDKNLELTISQLIGVAAATATGGDMAKAAELAKNATAYNRQLHPNEIKYIRRQAEELAREANITPAEAERRLAEAMAFYVDKNWNNRISASGVVLDPVTLKHLGIALAPLADRYAPPATGDVPGAPEGKTYSAAETLKLLQNYQLHHADFAMPLVNAEYLQLGGADSAEYKEFYARNLNYSQGNVSSGISGAFQGAGTAIGNSTQDTYQLGHDLVTNPISTTEKIVLGLLQTAADPKAAFAAFAQAKADADALGYLYRLQGNPEAAARVEMEWLTEFAMNFVTRSRFGASGNVKGTTKAPQNGKLNEVPNDPKPQLETGNPDRIPDLQNQPVKVDRIEDLFGQKFESIDLSHTKNFETGSLRNDGVLGEQLALQLLNERTTLNFRPLQNASNHGCDGCAVSIKGDTVTVVVMDAKSSQNGVGSAGTPSGDPEARLRKWLDDYTIANADVALRDELRAALASASVKVQGVTVKVGLPAPGSTGLAEFMVEAWPKK